MENAPPELTRLVTFIFTIDPKGVDVESLRRHLGSRRYPYNQGLALVKQALKEKTRVREHEGEKPPSSLPSPGRATGYQAA